MGLTLALLLLVGCERSGHDDGPQWNVLVVTLDTTRADRLGPYGWPDAGTPTFDALAAEGTVFEQASSTAPVTLPAHSTIFTGTYPPVHGVRDNSIFRLPDERTTLAEILAAGGWDTGAVVASVPLIREFGLAQGFGFYDDHVTVDAEDLRGRRMEPKAGLFFDERSASRVNDAILPWLRRPRERPFFAWIHYWDAHQPLHPPPPFDQIYAHDPYQGEISYVDHSFGVVVQALKELGEWERTLVVVVADHGEGLGQHQEDTHALLAYETTLHVPLMMRIPGLPGGQRIGRRVGTVDIVPTVLDFLGIQPPAEVQGRSLRPVLEDPARGGRERGERAVYYAEALTPRLSFGWGELRVLYRGDDKYIHGPRPELFDLATDPGELRDRSASEPELAERRRKELSRLLVDLASPDAAAAVHEVDPETLRRLEALGYMSAGAPGSEAIHEELRSDGAPPQDRAFDNSLVSGVKSFLAKSRWAMALEGADQLVQLDPTSAFYRGLRAQALIGLGRHAEAAALFEDFPSLDRADQAIVLDVARRIFTDGDQERAMTMLSGWIAARPSAPGHYLRSAMLEATGNDEDAFAELERAIELDPAYAPARGSFAVHSARRGQRELAEEHFVATIGLRPLNPRDRFNYAVFLLEQERVEEGLQQLRRAVELGPWYWPPHLTLLAVAVETGETAEANRLHADILERCRDPNFRSLAERIVIGAGTGSVEGVSE